MNCGILKYIIHPSNMMINTPKRVWISQLILFQQPKFGPWFLPNVLCRSYRVVPKLRTPLKGVLDFGLQRSTGGAGGRAKLVGGADLTTQLLASMLQLSTPEGVLNFGTCRYLCSVCSRDWFYIFNYIADIDKNIRCCCNCSRRISSRYNRRRDVL